MGKKIPLSKDLIGQKFGKLTIVDFQIAERNRQKCVCQCDCGNITVSTYRDLTTGHKKSCGCIKKNIYLKYQKLIGEKINHWTVQDVYSNGKEFFATCECDCGNIQEVRILNLVNDLTKDCGCGRKKMLSRTHTKDLTNQKFGKLTVIEMLPESDKFKRRRYSCLCNCGNKVILSSINLLSGGSKSCGCINSYYNSCIYSLLKEKSILFESEKVVMINGHNLRFDFYLPEYNLFIEYDGEQHYMPINFGGWNEEENQAQFEKRQYFDSLKNKYCNYNNINLLRIPYWDKDNIEEIILSHLQRLTMEGFAS